MVPKPALPLLLLAALLQVSAPALTLDRAAAALAARLADRDRTIQQLQADLHAARAEADARVAVVRSGLEQVNRSVESRLQQAQAEASSAQARADESSAQLSRSHQLLAQAQTELAATVRDRQGLTDAMAKLAAAQKQTAQAAKADSAIAVNAAQTTAEAAERIESQGAQVVQVTAEKLDEHDQLARVEAEALLMSSQSAKAAAQGSMVVSVVGFLSVVAGLWFKDRRNRRAHVALDQRITALHTE